MGTIMIDHNYFLNEWHGFRAIMCSTDYTPENKFDAWSGLLRVYLLCPFDIDENEELRKTCINILVTEFPLRMGLELAIKCEELFNEQKGR